MNSFILSAMHDQKNTWVLTTVSPAQFIIIKSIFHKISRQATVNRDVIGWQVKSLKLGRGVGGRLGPQWGPGATPLVGVQGAKPPEAPAISWFLSWKSSIFNMEIQKFFLSFNTYEVSSTGHNDKDSSKNIILVEKKKHIVIFPLKHHSWKETNVVF